MNHPYRQHGFSLVELLVAVTIFSFVVAGVSVLFVQALSIQRQTTGMQRAESDILFIMESLTREVRVSKVTSPNTASCVPAVGVVTLAMTHPVNGAVTYSYDPSVGTISRNGQVLNSAGVQFSSFNFCVSGSGADGNQVRVTMPMTVQTTTTKQIGPTSVSLQATIVSRDLTTDPIP